MAITQARVLTLLAEAKAWKDTTLLLKDSLTALRARPPKSVEACMETLFAITAALELPSSAAIDVETYHFRKFGRRNDRVREKLAQGRLGHDTAPESLAEGPARSIIDATALYSVADVEAAIKAAEEAAKEKPSSVHQQKDGTIVEIEEDPDVARPEDLEGGKIF